MPSNARSSRIRPTMPGRHPKLALANTSFPIHSQRMIHAQLANMSQWLPTFPSTWQCWHQAILQQSQVGPVHRCQLGVHQGDPQQRLKKLWQPWFWVDSWHLISPNAANICHTWYSSTLFRESVGGNKIQRMNQGTRKTCRSKGLGIKFHFLQDQEWTSSCLVIVIDIISARWPHHPASRRTLQRHPVS